MEKIRGNKINTTSLTLTFEHNPYETEIFIPKHSNNKTIIFPIFNYQASKQYIDLIYPLVEKGYRLITISLLNKGDRVLFFSYYFQVFDALLEDLHLRKIIGKEKDEIIIMGFGIGAYLASYCNFIKNEGIKISKIVLLSPVNKYKGEYFNDLPTE